MPIIAIGAAIIADIGVAGTVGGIIAGTTALTLTSALEIVGAVGATISAIGAVTGDKGLSMAGMIMGGIGGIGALASSAGLFGDAGSAPLFGSGTDVAAGSGWDNVAGGALDPSESVSVTGLRDASAASGGGAGADAAAGAGASGGAEDLIGQYTGTGIDVPSAQVSSGSQGLVPSGMPSTTGLLNTPTGTATPPAAVSIAGGAPGAAVAAPTAPGVVTPAAPVAPVAAAASKGGMFGGLLDFANKNPVVALGVLQAAGSFISGATSTLTPAQVDALNAQASQNQAAADQTKKQNSNMAEPIPVATRTPQGLLNTPVTGVAA